MVLALRALLRTPFLISLSLAVALGACGGKVVAEPEEGGGGGTSSGTTTVSSSGSTTTTSTTNVSSSVVTSTATGSGSCDDHADCPGQLCIFATGTCAPACGDFCDSCGPGAYCDGCATSSCFACADCLAACAPIAEPGRCDGDDSCPPGQICNFGSSFCHFACDANGQCASGFEFCEGCLTGSCCGCDDCVSGCVGGE